MITLKGNQIKMTKGDTLILHIEIKKDGEPYVVQEGDSIRFSVSEKYEGERGYVLHVSKQVNTENLLIRLDPEDTKSMKYKTYNYDVQMTYADGTVDTFISSTLTLIGEVE